MDVFEQIQKLFKDNKINSLYDDLYIKDLNSKYSSKISNPFFTYFFSLLSSSASDRRYHDEFALYNKSTKKLEKIPKSELISKFFFKRKRTNQLTSANDRYQENVQICKFCDGMLARNLDVKKAFHHIERHLGGEFGEFDIEIIGLNRVISSKRSKKEINGQERKVDSNETNDFIFFDSKFIKIV